MSRENNFERNYAELNGGNSESYNYSENSVLSHVNYNSRYKTYKTGNIKDPEFLYIKE